MSFTKYLKYTRQGKTCTPDRLRFGGDSNSDSSVDTRNDTTNNAYSVDRRNVASEEAVALSGDGNSVFKMNSSTSNTSMTDSRDSSTYFADSSNRSSTSTDITQMFDSRDMSTKMTDNRSTVDSRNMSTMMFDSSTRSDSSVRDSSTRINDNSIRTTSDFGSISAALGGITQMGTKALDVGMFSVEGAISSLKQTSADNQRSVSGAFDLARSAGANALSTSAQVLGFSTSALDKVLAQSGAGSSAMMNFAQNAIGQTNDAFALAKDKGDQKTVLYAMGAVAVIAIAFALKD